jgi:hypothetical protein
MLKPICSMSSTVWRVPPCNTTQKLDRQHFSIKGDWTIQEIQAIHCVAYRTDLPFYNHCMSSQHKKNILATGFSSPHERVKYLTSHPRQH